LILLVLLIWTLPVVAQTLPLFKKNWNWNKPLVQVEDVPASRVAQFTATGKEIFMGAWIAGNDEPRLEYQASLPVREGSIHGKFRTDGLYPREANIWITYKRGNQRLTELNYWLGVTEKWVPFDFPIITPPPGCDNIVVSFGFGMKTHGRVYLSDLKIIAGPHQLPPISAAKPMLTRATPPQAFLPGKSVRMEKVGNTSWLVDVNGN
jgi:hypothetical protein